jgi:hypothetical protein
MEQRSVRMMQRRRAGVWIIGIAIAAAACTRAPEPFHDVPAPRGVERHPAPSRSLAAVALPRSPAPPARTRADALPPPGIDRGRYPWLADATGLVVVDALEDRITPPPGFMRVALEPDSFGAFLRRLPLAAPGTPVRSYRGDVILAADHQNLAAVVAIDVGAQDLQQCADSVIRLHAEWRWSRGLRDQSYRAADRTEMPFARWARGERVRARGSAIDWAPAGKKADGSHAAFRAFLDAVFAFTNTVALARDTTPVDFAELGPGDFVVQAGSPGHAVLILDLASAPDGRRAVLLGQGYMPAQSFQVLRPSPRASSSAWFILDRGALRTPFWPVFPWSTLRRFSDGAGGARNPASTALGA